ncbi:hypothetical protein Mal48_08860 [Thalassoglobus polymorphus]|uniref:Uncharacterized protein n=2 Tax=Thalassoglobus polymorphus TaxID=2527994 RepID=A0A517QJ27_9PLAN|nr:hypothetical protein Mal48_08860 [Thalassoglobus polymorphus]
MRSVWSRSTSAEVVAVSYETSLEPGCPNMAKTLCDLQKKLKKDPEGYACYVVNPTHICKKCKRVANKKKRLCKPAKLDPPSASD